METAELDYAFLADFAQVSDNKLTTVGASYTHVYTSSVPGGHLLYIAGRIRCPENLQEVPLKIVASPPNKEFEIAGELTLGHQGEIRPYDGKVGLLFSMGINLPLPSEGLYEINLFLEDRLVRRLAFSVELRRG
ncbi:DUF6941 family protein [Glutamicibacter nicotianae]|uniref:Uncharacterized protein n=1 Tax=Glutamicibacter nicotianae TaxID=37929 RepID=A0ABQ0RMI8_GLUNI|nr:hypothetical protein [Glutamicibacter nicotianae]GEC12750.1 hypothetical protein ANI01nite_19530 [Glutamicibacter nicotianae]